MKKYCTVFPITRELNELQLAELYMIADILVLPSKGGGFELCGLEALSKGIPILYTEGLAMDDYAKGYGLPIKAIKEDKPWNNPIHCGFFYKPDIDDFYEKLNYALDNLDELKDKALKFREERAKEYFWDKICERLRNAIES